MTRSKSQKRRKPSKTQKRKSPKKSSRRKSPRKSSSHGRCDRSNIKKYVNRPGPPYPAQNCRNHLKIGNDGDYYKSKPNKRGIYRWVKV
jgi:hypothetical protein